MPRAVCGSQENHDGWRCVWSHLAESGAHRGPARPEASDRGARVADKARRLHNRSMELGREQRLIVQATYDVFRETGRWPSVDTIDRLADERWGIDAFAVLRTLPPDVALVDARHLREDQEVKLRVGAIAGCDNSRSDVELFLHAVRWLAEKERSFRPVSEHAAEQISVTSEQFAADLAAEGIRVDAKGLRKVYILANLENVTWGGSVDIDGESGKWQINLRRNIRPYRRVETLPDYLATRRRVEEAAAEEMLGGPGATPPVVLTEADADVRRRYVFIAMPFGELWSDGVHATIVRACESLGSEGVVLHWQRADEIARPGRITDQIVDAINACDAMVADLSGMNANVVYEVGFAHSNSTPVVLLNQNPESSPFDLRDMRQIAYTVERPDECLGRLVLQLRAALGVDGAKRTA